MRVTTAKNGSRVEQLVQKEQAVKTMLEVCWFAAGHCLTPQCEVQAKEYVYNIYE